MVKIDISFCILDPPNCLSGSFDPEARTAVLKSTVREPDGSVTSYSLVANLEEFSAFVDAFNERKNRGEFNVAP